MDETEFSMSAIVFVHVLFSCLNPSLAMLEQCMFERILQSSRIINVVCKFNSHHFGSKRIQYIVFDSVKRETYASFEEDGVEALIVIEDPNENMCTHSVELK
jgi:hypothetical protein